MTLQSHIDYTVRTAKSFYEKCGRFNSLSKKEGYQLIGQGTYLVSLTMMITSATRAVFSLIHNVSCVKLGLNLLSLLLSRDLMILGKNMDQRTDAIMTHNNTTAYKLEVWSYNTLLIKPLFQFIDGFKKG